MYGLIEREVRSRRSLRESMDRIIAKGARDVPHRDWERLAALPYEDLGELRTWIERPFRKNASKKKLAGLWFGLFNPVFDDQTVADIYLCGSTRFDLESEWYVDPEWWPNHRHAESTLFAKLYRIAYRRGGLGNDAEYPLCLGYGALAVRDLLRDVETELILGRAASLGIAVGFDSGDHVLLGKLMKQGLVPLP